MRQLRSRHNDFEIRARGIWRSCGKRRELGPGELLDEPTWIHSKY